MWPVQKRNACFHPSRAGNSAPTVQGAEKTRISQYSVSLNGHFIYYSKARASRPLESGDSHAPSIPFLPCDGDGDDYDDDGDDDDDVSTDRTLQQTHVVPDTCASFILLPQFY